MRFGPNLLEEVLRRTDLVQLVGRRVKLVRKGRAFWGCCPFHGEKSASFKVENERRTYKCFGCGVGGDAFKWLMETDGCSFPEAVERLAGEAGVELPKWSPEEEERAEKKKSLYDVVELACVFFEEQLFGKAGAEAREYLKGRGLDGAAAKKFRLGYAPANSELRDYLRGKNVTLDDMIAAGVVRPADGERGARDFFFDRVMFPITDPRGRVIAFGGRGMSPDAKPKYINTGETALFSKGHQLYNFATARPAAIKSGTIIVAEGYMDVIALVRAGFEHSVAPLGTALTEDQLHLLWRTAPEPIMAFDGDGAGLRAAHRAAHLALPHLKAGHSLRFVFLPAGEDPDSLINSSGREAMKALIDAAEPLSKVLWRAETEDKDFSTPERRAGLERALKEIVTAIGDQTIADYYRRDFDQKVFDQFKRRNTGGPPRDGNYGGGQRGRFQEKRGSFRRDAPAPSLATGEAVSPAVRNSLLARTGKTAGVRAKELELASLLLAHPELAAKQSESLADLPFADHSLDRFRHELLNLAASGFRLEKQALEAHLGRSGQAHLVERLAVRAIQMADEALAEDRFRLLAAQLREWSEGRSERAKAFERLKADGTEENWREAARFLGNRTD
ncbi:MAG TPA: DNA primase [Rhizomicrobium sp.]|nr:DNA primase [Rhizomicrobium sp.]